MSLFTYTPQNDGTVADVADINTPFAAVAGILNGGIDSTNIAAGSVNVDRLATAANPETRQRRNFVSYVVSGLTMSTSGTLSSAVAAGTAYVNGKEVNPSSFPKTFTASKDTYVDLKDDGTYVFVEVANNATSGMTLTLNSDGTPALRIARVVTSTTTVAQIHQGAFNTTPVAPNTLNWFGFDPIGNSVYNTSPNPTLIGYAQVASGQNVAAVGATDLTGLSIPVIVPANRRVKVSVLDPNCANTGASDNFIDLVILMDGAGVNASRNRVAGGDQRFLYVDIVGTFTAGLHTFKASTVHSSTQSMNHNSLGNIMAIKAELV